MTDGRGATGGVGRGALAASSGALAAEDGEASSVAGLVAPCAGFAPWPEAAGLIGSGGLDLVQSERGRGGQEQRAAQREHEQRALAAVGGDGLGGGVLAAPRMPKVLLSSPSEGAQPIRVSVVGLSEPVDRDVGESRLVG